jgi:tryptophanyl-tRNA synthetase
MARSRRRFNVATRPAILVGLSQMADVSKPRLLTGDRPTGPLHLGHLVGTLETRVALQDDHECFIIVADLHTLTTRPRRAEIDELPEHVRDVVIDQLAVGIDPAKATFYLQSAVPAVYDLAILLQMLVPKLRLEQIKSLRSMARAAAMPDDAMTMGLLGYPVLQAADILMARATVVPVGLDNEEHIAIARECASVFNELYGDLFPLPEAKISRWPALPGVATGPGGSGAKMSKSLGNAVFLRDTPAQVDEKIRTLTCDEADRRAPTGPALLVFARAFLGDDEATRMGVELVEGSLSLGAAHEAIVAAIERRLAPIRARRDALLEQTGLVEEIIVDGTIRAREVANATLQRTREAMGLEGLWAGLVSATQARAKARRRPY